jgi:hypothetical protein
MMKLNITDHLFGSTFINSIHANLLQGKLSDTNGAELSHIEGALLLGLLLDYGRDTEWAKMPLDIIEQRFCLKAETVIGWCCVFIDMGFLRVSRKDRNEYEFMISSDRVVELCSALFEGES